MLGKSDLAQFPSFRLQQKLIVNVSLLTWLAESGEGREESLSSSNFDSEMSLVQTSVNCIAVLLGNVLFTTLTG